MRYDQDVILLKRQPSTSDDTETLDHVDTYVATRVKANLQRANVTVGTGETYDATIIRVFGEYEADKIAFPQTYNPEDDSTMFNIQTVQHHFRRTDFFIAESEVVWHVG